jgi:hypothetical protein
LKPGLQWRLVHLFGRNFQQLPPAGALILALKAASICQLR